MIGENQVLELVMTAMKTSDEVGRLDACIDIVNKLCEVTKEEKDMIIAVLRSARGRLYAEGENAYWEIAQILCGVKE
ncbi:MAG: hypothetical protein IJV02_00150 [Candidatus Methanomethylophilaceae archaeon]|nr:hypothetical protein [Candidatus Methanomethylophilaceae archaeon]